MEEVSAALRRLGVDDATAESVAEVSLSLDEAETFARAAPGRRGFSSPFKEFFCLKHMRLYYAEDGVSETSWDPPPPLLLQEWRTDASAYGVSLPGARKVFEAIQAVLTHSDWDTATAALAVAAKLLGNIVDAGNAVAKFRVVKLTNARVSSAFGVHGIQDVLFAGGFVRRGDELVYPGDVADLNTASALVARMRRLLDGKGHTGSAVAVDNSGDGGGGSRWQGRPGFVYQQSICECCACESPINDGTDRLVTGSREAPAGEYRFSCTVCVDFHLCQRCWDRFQSGEDLHDRQHGFAHHGPRTQRHGLSRSESASNPWGIPLNPSSAARARERLRGRTGL